MANIAELDDRISKCHKILEENPNSQIFAALAEAYRKKGEMDKAFRSCQNGLRIHPNYGAAHVVMAKINLDKGLYDWAEIEINKAIELDGSSHTTELLLAEIYLYKGEFAKASRLLTRLHTADPANQHVIKLLDISKKLPLEAARKFEPVSKAETPAAEKSSEPVAEPADKVTIGQFLDNLANIPGVDGVLLINKEGLVADSRWEDGLPADVMGALARDIESTIQSQIEVARFGSYEKVILEAGDLLIIFMPFRSNLLMIKANKRINLGTLRLKLTSLLGRLADDTI